MKRHSLHTFFLAALVSLSALCFAACGGSSDGGGSSVYVPVASVSLKAATSLAAGSQTGATETLQPVIEPANATNKEVEWRSSVPGVATVSGDGLVEAVSAGTAVITVRTLDGGRTARCTVTVTTAVTDLTLDRRTLVLVRGYSETLVATVWPANATDKGVAWSSDAQGVATVSSSGRVTAVGAGSATITATTLDGAKKATCAVAVALETIHVAGVALNTSSMSLEANGAPGQLFATVLPAEATIKDVVWASSNNTVATVSADGLDAVVSGLANGTAIISVTTVSNSRSASCTVRVTGPVAVTGVSLNKTSTTLGLGASEILMATIRPSSATNQNVAWTSSAPGTVSVTQDGRITGAAIGSATVTVRTANGGFEDSCDVTVMAAAPTAGVSLNRGSIMLEVGKNQTLAATVDPPNANDKDVQWSTSNPDAASVSSTGVVTGVAPGAAVITARVATFQASCNVTVTTSMSMIGGGNNHTLAVRNDGTLWAWGRNNYGQIGDGGSTTTNRLTPQLIAPDQEWVRVAGSYIQSAALHANGTIWTWGRNNYGQLGLGAGNLTDRDVPTIAANMENDWVDVQQGYVNTLGLKSDGTLWICGYNNYGMFGAGNTANNGSEPTFRQIGTDSDWARVAVGYIHVLAIKTDGSLWAWGYNNNGQQGNGSSGTSVGTPTRIGGDNDWAHVACGGYFSLAIKADGTLYAWGYNYYGQLGDGTGTTRNSPTRIGDGWATVSGGNGHTLGVKTDGSLWAWGYNNNGQLGDGTTANKNTPQQIGNDFDWAFVKAVANTTDANTSYAVKEDGSLWAWGLNNYGQVGNGGTTNQTRPVRIMSLSE